MKVKWIATGLALALCCCALFMAPKAIRSKEEVALMEADLDYLCQELEARHKNLYFNITKEEFLRQAEKIRRQLPTMTEADYYYALCSLISRIGDAHTAAHITTFEIPQSPLAYEMSMFEGKWHLLRVLPEHQAYLGYQVTAINHVPIEKVQELAKSLISYENEVYLLGAFPQVAGVLEALQYLGVVPPAETGITLQIMEDAGSPTQTISIPALSIDQYLTDWSVSLSPPTEKLHDYYGVQELSPKDLYIQYNTCAEDPAYPMADFATQLEQLVQTSNHKKIIIDLRRNSGGNDAVVKPILKVLRKYQHIQGYEVYTLIGSSTFSSGVINAVYAVDDVDTTLVGTPTGGQIRCYGNVLSFSLPNHPITVMYSTKYFDLIPGYPDGPLLPDITAAQTYKDFEQGIDTALQTILQLP